MSPQQPANSKIIVEKNFDGTLVFKLPRAGWNYFTVFFCVFATVWNSVTYYLFFHTIAPKMIFVTFIPVGIFAFLALVYLLRIQTVITIKNDTINISKFLFGRAMTKSSSFENVKNIGLGVAYIRHYQPVYGTIDLLLDPPKIITFGSGLFPEDRNWLINELKSLKEQSASGKFS